MTDAPLAVFGAGGFLLQMLPTLERLQAEGRTIAIVDDRGLPPVFGIPVVPLDAAPANSRFVVAVAGGRTRAAIVDRLESRAFDRVIAPGAIVSRHSEIGIGSVLCDHVIVEPASRIGRHFHGNIYSYVAHECVIGDFVTFAPRVSCNGNVHIRDHVTVGTGASFRQGTPDRPLVIGERAVIQMGAVITRDVPADAVIKANTRH